VELWGARAGRFRQRNLLRKRRVDPQAPHRQKQPVGSLVRGEDELVPARATGGSTKAVHTMVFRDLLRSSLSGPGSDARFQTESQPNGEQGARMARRDVTRQPTSGAAQNVPKTRPGCHKVLGQSKTTAPPESPTRAVALYGGVRIHRACNRLRRASSSRSACQLFPASASRFHSRWTMPQRPAG
jgi:hypothetical protein